MADTLWSRFIAWLTGRTTVPIPTPPIPTPAPPAPPDMPTVPLPTPPNGDLTSVLALVQAHNNERTRLGLRQLLLDLSLRQAAQRHADWMARNRSMSHEETPHTPNFIGTTLVARLLVVQYAYWTAGENVAVGQQTVEKVMTAWMNSAAHRANILNGNYSDIGTGFAIDTLGQSYWCAVFGAQRTSRLGLRTTVKNVPIADANTPPAVVRRE